MGGGVVGWGVELFGWFCLYHLEMVENVCHCVLGSMLVAKVPNLAAKVCVNSSKDKKLFVPESHAKVLHEEETVM